jgi:hypothetical protein
MTYLKRKSNAEPVIQTLYTRKRLTRKVTVLLISLIITLFFILALLAISRTQFAPLKEGFYLTAGETTYSNIKIELAGPNYFFPNAEIHTIFESHYGNSLENVTVCLSLDNSTWVAVPFSSGAHDVIIGSTHLDGFPTPVYLKCYSQDATVMFQNQSLSIYDAINSSDWYFTSYSIITSQSIVLLCLTSIAIFSFLVQILDFLAKDKLKRVNGS